MWGTILAAMMATTAASSTVVDPEPWKRPDAIIIPDPYYQNAFDFDRALADPKIKAVILKAASGLSIDPALRDRARIARQRGIPFGIYLLGVSAGTPRKPGTDPIAQADLLVRLGRELGATFLALDIEDQRPTDMSLDDAARFVARVHDQTERYPAFYGNKKVANAVAARFGADSIFAKSPLWIAGTKPFAGNRVWPSFAIWQFGAEWDCPDAVKQDARRRKTSLYRACAPYRRYPVAGSEYDLDINVLNGGSAELEALFGSRSSPSPTSGASSRSGS